MAGLPGSNHVSGQLVSIVSIVPDTHTADGSTLVQYTTPYFIVNPHFCIDIQHSTVCLDETKKTNALNPSRVERTV